MAKGGAEKRKQKRLSVKSSSSSQRNKSQKSTDYSDLSSRMKCHDNLLIKGCMSCTRNAKCVMRRKNCRAFLISKWFSPTVWPAK